MPRDVKEICDAQAEHGARFAINKYDSPFEVLERSGSDVKLQLAAKDR